MRTDDLNSVEIKLQLVADPELRYTANRTPIINVRAVYRRMSKGAERLSYFSVVQFGGNAEENATRLRAWQMVEVYGRLEEDRWTGPKGQRRSRVQIVAESIEPLDEVREPRVMEESVLPRKSAEYGYTIPAPPPQAEASAQKQWVCKKCGDCVDSSMVHPGYVAGVGYSWHTKNGGLCGPVVEQKQDARDDAEWGRVDEQKEAGK